MKTRNTFSPKDQNGLAPLMLLLLVVAVVAVALVGYRVASEEKGVQEGDTAKTIPSAPGDINNKADLEKTNEAVNLTPVDEDLSPDDFDADEQSLQ